jgi:hypothetical protein
MMTLGICEHQGCTSLHSASYENELRRLLYEVSGKAFCQHCYNPKCMIWLFYCLVHLRYWPIHFSLGQMARRQTQTWQEVQQFNSVSVNCSTQEIKNEHWFRFNTMFILNLPSETINY